MAAKRTSGNNPPEGASRVRQGRTRSRSEREVEIPRTGVARSNASFWRDEVRNALPGRARSSPGSNPVRSATDSNKLYRGKVTRSWRRCSSTSPLAHVNRRNAGDFVLCQGESGSGASLGACDGSGGIPSCSSRCLADV